MGWGRGGGPRRAVPHVPCLMRRPPAPQPPRAQAPHLHPELWAHIYDTLHHADRARGAAVCAAANDGLHAAGLVPAGPLCPMPPPVTYGTVAPRPAVYRPIAADLTERLFEGNVSALVGHLIQSEEIDRDELVRLRALIVEREREETGDEHE